MEQLNGPTFVPELNVLVLNRRFLPVSSKTSTSKQKYLCKFFTNKTRKGILMPSVCLDCSGQVTEVVLTLFPAISKAADPMSSSVIRRICPFRTDADQR